MELDERNTFLYNIYTIVRSQVRVSPMGDPIALDYGAVLSTIKLYVTTNKVKEAFEYVLTCFNIEMEFVR